MSFKGGTLLSLTSSGTFERDLGSTGPSGVVVPDIRFYVRFDHRDLGVLARNGQLVHKLDNLLLFLLLSDGLLSSRIGGSTQDLRTKDLGAIALTSETAAREAGGALGCESLKARVAALGLLLDAFASGGTIGSEVITGRTLKTSSFLEKGTSTSGLTERRSGARFFWFGTSKSNANNVGRTFLLTGRAQLSATATNQAIGATGARRGRGRAHVTF